MRPTLYALKTRTTNIQKILLGPKQAIARPVKTNRLLYRSDKFTIF